MTLSKERLGKFTASGIHKLFVGGKGATRESYIQEKAEEAVLGHARMFSNRNTEHGHMNEYEAIESFQEVSGLLVEYLEQEYFPINENCGSTPDAKVVDFSGNTIASVDVKCPTTQFFSQKMMMVKESKPEYQNVPKEYFYQAQVQMMSLGVDTHYLVRYLTKSDLDYEGNKIEYNLPLNVRLYWKKITADPIVQQSILDAVELAAKERDLLIEIFTKPMIEE
jgi:hypothetical protein